MKPPNAEQRRAVERPAHEPVAVIAGAGTGKTHLLAARFLHLTQVAGLAPERILCMTFTRKAALNMRARILAALRAGAEPVPQPESLWITTFDGAAWRILSDDLLATGLPPDARLLTEVEKALLRDRVWDAACAEDPSPFAATFGMAWEAPETIKIAAFDALESLAKARVPAQDIPHRLGPDRETAYADLRAHFVHVLRTHPKFAGRAAMERALPALESQEEAERVTAEFLAVLGTRYAAARADAHGLDFADVLERATALCASQSRWRDRFDAILLDECQDTNGAQFRFVQALAAPDYGNVTVVGDRKQSIYAFQGARPENTAALPTDPIPLVRNYRSVGEILDVAHHVIRDAMPDDPPLTPELRGHAHAPRVWFTRLPGEAQEAAWVAAEIRSLAEAGVPLEHIMVLVRTRARFHAVCAALAEAEVPYEMVDKRAGWDREILKTALALLRAMVDPLDDLALVRLLQEPPLALADAALDDLLGHRERRSVYEALRAAPDPALRRRADDLATLAAAVDTTPGAECVSRAMRDWGLLEVALAGDDAARPDFRALAQLYGAAARAFAAVPAPTLREFVAAIRDGRVEIQADRAADQAAQRTAVRLCNVHQVKGLEFPVVFVTGLGAPRFPHTQISPGLFGFDEHLGFAQTRTWDGDPMARWQLAASVAYETDLRGRSRAQKIAEERRLLYVAMTRAQERLYLTTSASPPKPERVHAPEYFVEQLESRIRDGHPAADALAPDAHAPQPLPQEVTAIRAAAPRVRDAPPGPDADELRRQATAARDRLAWSPRALPPRGVVTLSWTQVFTYRQCPRLYDYRYRRAVPAPDGTVRDSDEPPGPGAGGLAARVKGILLHRALERFHEPAGAATGNVQAALDLALPELELTPPGARAEAADLLARYAGWAVARADVAECEARFVLCLPATDDGPAVRVRGAIDRIDRVGDGIAIWDYKTGRADADHLRATYAEQLQLYAHAAAHALGYARVRRAGLIALEAPAESDAVVGGINVGPEERDAVITRVRDTAQGVAQARFAVEAGGGHAARPCGGCEYRSWCPDRRAAD